MQVRVLEAPDVSVVGALFKRIEHDPSAARFHPHPFTFAQAEQICNFRGKDLYLGGFAENGSLVAYGMLRGWDEGYDVPSLGIYLAPEVRGSGISKEFMRALHRAAFEAGASRIMLKVYPENGKAVALYRSLGYQFVEDGKPQITGYLDL